MKIEVIPFYGHSQSGDYPSQIRSQRNLKFFFFMSIANALFMSLASAETAAADHDRDSHTKRAKFHSNFQYQGHLLAKDLVTRGLQTKLITDSAVFAMISRVNME